MLIKRSDVKTPLVADLAEGPGGPEPHLFWIKKEEITKGRIASRASKSKRPPFLSTPPPALAQGLDFLCSNFMNY